MKFGLGLVEFVVLGGYPLGGTVERFGATYREVAVKYGCARDLQERKFRVTLVLGLNLAGLLPLRE